MGRIGAVMTGLWAAAMAAAAAEAGGGAGADTLALKELTVTAARMPLAASRAAVALTVLRREEIATSGARDLAELLDGLPGLDLSRAGGPGGTTTLRLRGLGDGHTLLLVDGVELNDPSSTSRAADLATLPLDQVERVEVLRGPQSALYGADALGGVVQVVTRAGVPGLALGLYGGDRGQAGGRLAWAGRRGPVAASLSGGRDRQEGWSAARGGSSRQDDDGLARDHGRLLAEWRPRPGLAWTAAVDGERSRADLDAFGGEAGDDPNFRALTRRLGSRLQLDWTHALGRSAIRLWEQRTWREYDNPVDPWHPTDALTADYQGRVGHAGLEQHLPLPGGHTLMAALDWERERASSSSLSASAWGPWAERFAGRQAHGLGLVLQDQWARGPWSLGACLRRDWRTDQPEAWTGRLSAAVAPGEAILARASLGSGFKAPSLYQLHGAYGNPGLEAERSRGWDAGVEWRGSGWRAALGIFDTRVRRQIDFDGAAMAYANLDHTRSRGVELEAAGPLAGSVAWSLRGTRLRAEDAADGAELPRRPGFALRLGLDAARGPLAAALIWRHESRRVDLAFDSATYASRRVSLAAWSTLDARLAWTAARGLTTWLQGWNLLDAGVEEVWGYAGQPRSWRAGVDWQI